MHVTGYWRADGWVRSHFKAPNAPGDEQLALGEAEVEVPRQREPALSLEVAEEVRDHA